MPCLFIVLAPPWSNPTHLGFIIYRREFQIPLASGVSRARLLLPMRQKQRKCHAIVGRID
jgi:hypothetical protein